MDQSTQLFHQIIPAELESTGRSGAHLSASFDCRATSGFKLMPKPVLCDYISQIISFS